jgi:hypothetical protein
MIIMRIMTNISAMIALRNLAKAYRAQSRNIERLAVDPKKIPAEIKTNFQSNIPLLKEKKVDFIV